MTYVEMSEIDDPRELRRVFGAFPSGVVAVAGLGEAGPVGVAASSFTSVSLDPPLVSVCIAKTSTTWPSLEGLSHLGISVFSDGQADACRQLSAKSKDRFDGLDWQVSADGAVFLGGASAWFDCTIEDQLVGGDHYIVLLGVQRTTHHDLPPLVFQGSRFRKLGGPLEH